MINEFVQRWEQRKHLLRESLGAKKPENYEDIFRRLVSEVLHDEEVYWSPDPARIVVIDHGDYQGTLLFVVGVTGYQPCEYWTCAVSYGSCSGCDTFQSIRDEGRWDDPTCSGKQLDEYMTLALHMLQGLKSTEAER